jgi:hypothetical protein
VSRVRGKTALEKRCSSIRMEGEESSIESSKSQIVSISISIPIVTSLATLSLPVTPLVDNIL